MFFKGTRYESVETDSIIDAEGGELQFKKVRFIPETSAFLKHTVAPDERLDQISFTYFRDAELFWRIADANRAMKADDLVSTPGRSIGIPASEG